MKIVAILLLIMPFWANNSLAQDKDIAGLLQNKDNHMNANIEGGEW